MTAKPLVYRHAKPAYLNPEAFAEHFGVSTMTGYRLIHGGLITAHRIGRAYRIHVSEIERYARDSVVEPEVSL